MSNPTIIFISGGEFAGKTTTCSELKKLLASVNHRRTHFAREPGGTPKFEAIRSEFKSDPNIPVERQYQMMWDGRFDLLENFIIPHLLVGDNVVLDRNFLCTFAYQIYMGNLINSPGMLEDYWEKLDRYFSLIHEKVGRGVVEMRFLTMDRDPADTQRERSMTTDHMDNKPLEWHQELRAIFKWVIPDMFAERYDINISECSAYRHGTDAPKIAACYIASNWLKVPIL